MRSYIFLLLSLSLVLSEDGCYFNNLSPYQLFSSKTPYDTIRGDIRDYKDPEGCETISIWTLNRHGNRNPGNDVTAGVKEISLLKDDIIASFEAGRGSMCAQDIDLFRRWTWNETLEVSQSFLTGIGYEELYDIGRRIAIRYPHLLNSSNEDYYFRPTNEQRTVVSAVAYVNGLTEGSTLNLTIDGVREYDEVIRPYEQCVRYQDQVKGAPIVDLSISDFETSPQYVAVQNNVQQRLGISKVLSASEIYSFYELCRFDRSWVQPMQSPWCSVFSNDDLMVLEYRDDVRHYYRNGYGSWVNVMLGGLAMRDLYENFIESAEGRGKSITSYFTHDTMMEMVFCALGLYKDDAALLGTRAEPDRLWRTSYIAALSNNLISILYRCQDTSSTYRVQILHNEKLSGLCPSTGCTWEEFQLKFQPFANATLDFCSLDYPEPVFGSSAAVKVSWLLSFQMLAVWIIRL